MTVTDWYTQSGPEVLAALNTHLEHGLTDADAARRLAESGPNTLQDNGAKSPWRILWEQFTATMVLILLAAAGLSLILQKWTEAISILAIVVLFALLGFVQEYRAERAMAALKKLTVPTVRVRRAGVARDLSARDLVPGDIIMLEAGNMIPADVRLLESVNLRVQESALTGESEAVEKEVTPLTGADIPLGDRRNLGYMGTLVTYGRGVAVVVQTGMRTELGKIATLIQSVKQELTPLQIRLDQVGKTLAVAGALIAILILGIGLLRREPLNDMLLTAISVAVAVVPEGLPAVVTFTLALGAQRMLKRNALIRKLPAVETLGSVTTICSDKTGTLTENRMTVTVVDVAGHRLHVTEALRRQRPALSSSAPTIAPSTAIQLLLTGGALCNDAQLQADAALGGFQTLGDPTEGALLVAAAQAGLLKDRLQAVLPRVAELPFDSDRKRMTTVHHMTSADAWSSTSPWDQPYIAFTKGSADGLLDISTQVWNDSRPEPLTEAWRTRIRAANDELARDGMRVLGIAARPVGQPTARPTLETDLIFVGLVGMMDPPRPEVKQAVQIARMAGIRPVMITGDHPLTAVAIAKELGIAQNDQVLTGQDLNRLTEAELEMTVGEVSVYARVSPEHKLKIVEALQSRGHIVAMTGDGVNDAPALKKADIGVAMGITGTDVSKEAADMVLRDDNFATIVAAVEEGRVIYDNVRRFVKFSIAGNIGKVGVMLFAPLVGINVALLPLQLLWLNLLTDGLLGLGMGMEPAEKNTMRRPPYPPNAGLFSRGIGVHVTWVGGLMGGLALGVGWWYYQQNLPQWQTMIFTTLALAQIGQALATRSMRESLFGQGLFSNRLLVVMVALVAGLQLGALYLPGLEHFFKIEPLPLVDLLVCVALGGLVFGTIELEKWLIRRRG